MSALSDSTTSTMSPMLTLSPTLISHCEILPSVIVDESAGIMIANESTMGPAGAAAGAGAAGAGATLAAGAAPPALTAAMSALLATSRATGAPTAAVSPSPTRIFAMKPSSYDSTSMSALSDSTTSTISPGDTLSPSLSSHDEIFPSVMVDERAGMRISVTSAIESAATRAGRVAWRRPTAVRPTLPLCRAHADARSRPTTSIGPYGRAPIPILRSAQILVARLTGFFFRTRFFSALSQKLEVWRRA